MTSYVSAFTGQVIQPTDVSYESYTFSSSIELSWPVEVDTSGNYAARIMDISATASGLYFRMPPANQTSVGTDALIRNVGANAITVQDNSGGTIISIAPGIAQYIYITDNSTVAGVWGQIQFGAGSSGGSAAALAGKGLMAIASTLNQALPISIALTDFTANVADDRAKAFVWQGGAGTITLPPAASCGNNWFFYVRNEGTGLLTIDPNGAELINGDATLSMQPDDSAAILCSGTGFFTFGLGRSTIFAYSQLVLPLAAYSGSTRTLTPAEASNTIIKMTGALTGNVTVIIPPTVQVYYLINACTGAFSITFSTGILGSATATIAANQQSTIVCDSANVYNANNALIGALAIQLINGSVSSPSLTFNVEPTTGMYRPTGGQIGWTVLGSNVMTMTGNPVSSGGGGILMPIGISGGVF